MKRIIAQSIFFVSLLTIGILLPFSGCDPDPGLPLTDSTATNDSISYNYIYNTYMIDSWQCILTGVSDSSYQLNIAQDSTNSNQVIISNFANTENQLVGVIDSIISNDSITITIHPQFVFIPNSTSPSIIDSIRFWGHINIFPDSIIFVHHFDIGNDQFDSCISDGHPQ